MILVFLSTKSPRLHCPRGHLRQQDLKDLLLTFFKEGLLKWLRGALPYMQTASAVLLILAGAYVVFYWWAAQSVGSPPR
jgi:hypothetical protein